MTHKCSNQNSEGCNCKDTKCPTAEDVERYKRVNLHNFGVHICNEKLPPIR